MVPNPARGQLNRGNVFSCVSRDRFDHPVQHQPAHAPHPGCIWCLLSRGPSIASTAIWSIPSSSGHAIAYRWRCPPGVRRHRASNLQGNLRNGCCLIRQPHHEPLMRAPLLWACAMQRVHKKEGLPASSQG